MIILVSPAKKLEFEEASPIDKLSQPEFIPEVKTLLSELKKLSKDDLSKMMKISDKLTELNYDRYHSFEFPFNKQNAKQAIYTFRGDTYVGFNADTLPESDIEYAQEHMLILSGLYGILRPLDLMQPYRLEMGTSLNNEKGKDLYQFWGDKISEFINDNYKDEPIINLASNEYIKSVNQDKLKAKFITPQFKEIKDGKAKIVGLLAKRARGSMARYIVKNKIEKIEDLKDFDYGDYKYQDDLSSDVEFVFTRESVTKKN